MLRYLGTSTANHSFPNVRGFEPNEGYLARKNLVRTVPATDCKKGGDAWCGRSMGQSALRLVGWTCNMCHQYMCTIELKDQVNKVRTSKTEQYCRYLKPEHGTKCSTSLFPKVNEPFFKIRGQSRKTVLVCRSRTFLHLFCAVQIPRNSTSFSPPTKLCRMRTRQHSC